MKSLQGIIVLLMLCTRGVEALNNGELVVQVLQNNRGHVVQQQITGGNNDHVITMQRLQDRPLIHPDEVRISREARACDGCFLCAYGLLCGCGIGAFVVTTLGVVGVMILSNV